ncbi:MAG: hypothetical protein AB1724_00255 [Thermodesulfobacteriota bacterium]
MEKTQSSELGSSVLCSKFIDWWENQCNKDWLSYNKKNIGEISIVTKYSKLKMENLKRYYGSSFKISDKIKGAKLPDGWNHPYWPEAGAKVYYLYESKDITLFLITVVNEYAFSDNSYQILSSSSYISAAPFSKYVAIDIEEYSDVHSEEGLGGAFEIFWLNNKKYPEIAVTKPEMNGVTIYLYIFDETENEFILSKKKYLSF